MVVVSGTKTFATRQSSLTVLSDNLSEPNCGQTVSLSTASKISVQTGAGSGSWKLRIAIDLKEYYCLPTMTVVNK